MNPDPDPDALVNAMSIGQYDTSHQGATRLPILHVVLPHILHRISVQLKKDFTPFQGDPRNPLANVIS